MSMMCDVCSITYMCIIFNFKNKKIVCTVGSSASFIHFYSSMASHDQFDAAPGVALDVVPVVAPAAPLLVATPDVVPIAAPIAAPTTAPHVARRVARGGARVAAHGVPRRRAHCVAHILAPGAALGGGGPVVAPGVAPIPS